jgi:hypothetical protein
MHISVEHTVWCDRCNHWEQDACRKKAVFERIKRRAGWRMRKGKTLCPKCLEELKEKRAWDDVGYRRSDR